MVTKGLLVRLIVKHGKDEEIEAFLSSALPLVKQETGTIARFTIYFGSHEYGIFNFFPDGATRDVHLNGEVAKALLQKADELFAAPPNIQKIDVLANKLPQAALAEPNTKGILLTFKVKDGQEQEVVEFLKNAQPLAMEEEQTTAWFAIRSPSDNQYGMFDVFPHNAARLKHMTGHIPRKLAKQSLTLLGSFPEMQLLTVTSENFNL